MRLITNIRRSIVQADYMKRNAHFGLIAGPKMLGLTILHLSSKY